jgi:hypothetical protein
MPNAAFRWISDVDVAESLEELEEKDGDKFERLNAVVSAGLGKIVHGEFQREINLKEEELGNQRPAKMLNGRQFAWLLYKELEITRTAGAMVELKDLWRVTLKGDNLKQLVNDWNTAVQGMDPKKIPDEATMEMLFSQQIEKSVQFNSMMTRYEEHITLGLEVRSYERLKKLVAGHITAKRLKKNQSVARGGGKGDALAAGKKGGGGRGKGNDGKKNRVPGECFSWRDSGACIYGDQCSFDHVGAPPRKGGGGKKGGGKGGQGKGKDKGKGPPKRGKSPSGKTELPPCFDHAKGKCTRGSNCDFWHPGPCRDFKAGKCAAGDRCCFPHGDKNAAPAAKEQPNKTKKEKKAEKAAEATALAAKEAKKIKQKEKRAAKKEKKALIAAADGG